MKIDYPRDKLQLLVVDDQDADKRLKGILPNDSRIKILNITQKDKEQVLKTFPTGYKLNIANKYASHDLIFHFFDTNVYAVDNFKSLIKGYIVSKKYALTSVDTGFLNEKSLVAKIPDLANLLYHKQFWKACSFDEKEDDSIVLMKKFFAGRYACFGFVPFIQCSFKMGAPYSSKHKELPFSLKHLVPKSTRESFDVCFK